jgi:hypothetical protein
VGACRHLRPKNPRARRCSSSTRRNPPTSRDASRGSHLPLPDRVARTPRNPRTDNPREGEPFDCGRCGKVWPCGPECLRVGIYHGNPSRYNSSGEIATLIKKKSGRLVDISAVPTGLRPCEDQPDARFYWDLMSARYQRTPRGTEYRQFFVTVLPDVLKVSYPHASGLSHLMESNGPSTKFRARS